MRKLFTSESVTEGHPDKVCDRISDAVLDAVLAKDSEGRVACETCCTTDTVFIAGEITSKVNVDEEKLCNAVDRCFELTPLGIIEALNLRLPIYEQTSDYGHFGNVVGGNFTWESTHKAGLLRRTYNTL